MILASNLVAARQLRSWRRSNLFAMGRSNERLNGSDRSYDHTTSRAAEPHAQARYSAEELAALRSQVQAGLDLVEHHQNAIDWQIQVLHRQFDLLLEYSIQITDDIVSLEQKWRDLETARAKLHAAEQQLQDEEIQIASKIR